MPADIHRSPPQSRRPTRYREGSTTRRKVLLLVRKRSGGGRQRAVIATVEQPNAVALRPRRQAGGGQAAATGDATVALGDRQRRGQRGGLGGHEEEGAEVEQPLVLGLGEPLHRQSG